MKKVSTKFGLNFASYISSGRNTVEAEERTHCVQKETKWILLSKWNECVCCSTHNQCAIAVFVRSFCAVFQFIRFSCPVCTCDDTKSNPSFWVDFICTPWLIHNFSIFLSDIHRLCHNAQFWSLSRFATIFLCVILSYNLLVFVLSFFLSFNRSFVRSFVCYSFFPQKNTTSEKMRFFPWKP